MDSAVFLLLWFIIGFVSCYRYLRLLNPHLPSDSAAVVFTLGLLSVMCSFMGPLASCLYGFTWLAARSRTPS